MVAVPCLRHRFKRIRVWLFLCKVTLDWFNICLIVGTCLLLMFVLYYSRRPETEFDADNTLHLLLQADRNLSRAGLDLHDMLEGHGQHLEQPLQPLSQFADRHHLHHRIGQVQHKHVRKGFYKTGFSAKGSPGQTRLLTAKMLGKMARNLNKGPGKDGQKVQLTHKERRKVEAVFSNWGFNIVASQKVSSHRQIVDRRDPACSQISQEFPYNASVIITFHNEAWSTLVRTLWSLIHNTKDNLIHEIILIDDFSDKTHLRKKFSRFIKKHMPEKVKLKRLEDRQGVIRSRLIGAKMASGSVLVFLDSHMEFVREWLPPLFEAIRREDGKAVVSPHLDVIDYDNMEYIHMQQVPLGGFSWDGYFRYHEFNRQPGDISPIDTPVLPGGVFAVDRTYFFQMGGLDEGMDFWGGENIELSWRVWMCGGKATIAPCSKMGHMYKPMHGFRFGSAAPSDVLLSNTKRAISLWTDSFVDLFRLYSNFRLDEIPLSLADTDGRRHIKSSQKCHNFRWYLDNVYPGLLVPTDDNTVRHFGRVQSVAANFCLVAVRGDTNVTGHDISLGQHRCLDFDLGSEFFCFTRDDRLQIKDLCATVNIFEKRSESSVPVSLELCDRKRQDQNWRLTEQGQLSHVTSGKCLDLFVGARKIDNKMTAFVSECEEGKNQQKWVFLTDHAYQRAGQS